VICVARIKGHLTWFYSNGEIAHDDVTLQPTFRSFTKDKRHLFQQFFVGKVNNYDEEEEDEE
jgi:hypothetical protein